MIKKITYCVTGLLCCVALCGCSYSIKDSERIYRDDLSRAKNISNLFGYHKVHDSEAPNGYDGDGSFLWNSTVWAANLDGAANINGFLPGISGWGAVGVGLGLGLLQRALTPPELHECSSLIGYYPAQQAKSLDEARTKFVEEATNALVKATKKQLPNASVNVIAHKSVPQSFMIESFYYTAIHIVDKKMGCLSNAEAKRRDDTCLIIVKATNVTGPDFLPKMLLTDEMGYKISPTDHGNSLITWGSTAQKIDLPKLYASTAPYMPKNAFFYVASQKNLKGEITPPFIVETNRVNFFIKPNRKTN